MPAPWLAAASATSGSKEPLSMSTSMEDSSSPPTPGRTTSYSATSSNGMGDKMLLVVDVGNTNTVMGLYDGAELRANWRVMTGNYQTVDEFRILLAMLLHQEGLDHARITGCCVSSVVPQVN